MDVEKFSLKGTVLNVADSYCRGVVTNLKTVATTGSYNDLSDKPDIPNITYNDTNKTIEVS